MNLLSITSTFVILPKACLWHLFDISYLYFSCFRHFSWIVDFWFWNPYEQGLLFSSWVTQLAETGMQFAFSISNKKYPIRNVKPGVRYFKRQDEVKKIYQYMLTSTWFWLSFSVLPGNSKSVFWEKDRGKTRKISLVLDSSNGEWPGNQRSPLWKKRNFDLFWRKKKRYFYPFFRI